MKQVEIKKLNNIETFFAIIKGYMSINVLLVPRAFVNGGFVLSPLAVLLATCFEATCAVKLSNIAFKYKVYNYPAIAQKAIGKWGLYAVTTLLALSHF